MNGPRLGLYTAQFLNGPSAILYTTGDKYVYISHHWYTVIDTYLRFKIEVRVSQILNIQPVPSFEDQLLFPVHVSGARALRHSFLPRVTHSYHFISWKFTGNRHGKTQNNGLASLPLRPREQKNELKKREEITILGQISTSNNCV